jgi:hypothetical protein
MKIVVSTNLINYYNINYSGDILHTRAHIYIHIHTHTQSNIINYYIDKLKSYLSLYISPYVSIIFKLKFPYIHRAI